MKKTLLSSAIVILSTTYAVAQSKWEFRYSQADEAGQISSCNAEIRYTDGDIIARIYGDHLDFFFSKSSFALPPKTELGKVAFIFKTSDFVLSAFSGENSRNPAERVSHMFMYPDKSEYASLLENLRVADSFTILFPDETNLAIGLTGSDTALSRASKCWKENETGSFGENPFNSSDLKDENPFN